jgi:hypothetical protein
MGTNRYKDIGNSSDFLEDKKPNENSEQGKNILVIQQANKKIESRILEKPAKGLYNPNLFKCNSYHINL